MEQFNDAVFWPAFQAAGMLTEIKVLLPGCTKLKSVMVGWSEPDFDIIGNQSKRYEIEYQFGDMPTLEEGVQITKDGGLFRVREAPFVPPTDIEGNNGFYRRAVLTKVLS